MPETTEEPKEKPKKNEPKGDAEKDDIYGKYLFGSRRGNEPNTREENDLDWALTWHIRDNSSASLSQKRSELVDLKNSGKYGQYLEPDADEAYRSMVFYDPKNVEKLLNVPFEEIQKQVDAKGYAVFHVMKYLTQFGTDSGVSSWTVKLDPSIIQGFTTYDYWNVLMKARVSSGDFVFDYKELAKIVDNEVASYLNTEKEVMLFGKALVDTVVVIPPKTEKPAEKMVEIMKNQR